MMQKNLKMTEPLAHGYSSESTQQELSNEYQHDRVKMVFRNLCALVLWTKVTPALEGLSRTSITDLKQCDTFSHSILVYLVAYPVLVLTTNVA